MKKIAITANGIPTGQWFNEDTSDYFYENTYFNGSNHISKSTGSQTEHETLYLTKSGRWIIKSWSDWQGSKTTYELISPQEAAEWFVKNEYDNDKIPEHLHRYINDLEL